MWRRYTNCWVKRTGLPCFLQYSIEVKRQQLKHSTGTTWSTHNDKVLQNLIWSIHPDFVLAQCMEFWMIYHSPLHSKPFGITSVGGIDYQWSPWSLIIMLQDLTALLSDKTQLHCDNGTVFLENPVFINACSRTVSTCCPQSWLNCI